MSYESVKDQELGENKPRSIHSRIAQTRGSSYLTIYGNQEHNSEIAERMLFVIREFEHFMRKIRDAKPYQQMYILYLLVDEFAAMDEMEHEIVLMFEHELGLIKELQPLPHKKDLVDLYREFDKLRSKVDQNTIRTTTGLDVHVWEKVAQKEDTEKLRPLRENAKDILILGLDNLRSSNDRFARFPLLDYVIYTFKISIKHLDHMRFFMNEARWKGAVSRAEKKQLLVWTCVGSLLRSCVEDDTLQANDLNITPLHSELGGGLRKLSSVVMPKFCAALQQYRGLLLSQELVAGNIKTKALAAMITGSLACLQLVARYLYEKEISPLPKTN